MIWIVLSIILFIIVFLHVFFPRTYNSISAEWKISKLPGPFRLPYFGNVHYFLIPNEEYLPQLTRLYNKYKPIYQIDFIGVLHAISSDVTQIEVILNSRKHITKGYHYVPLMPWLGTGLLTSDGKKWFDHRKWLTPAFHFGILEQYIDVFNKNASILVEQLMSYGKINPVEINPIISLCTLDVICETAMGTQVNAQKGGEKEFVEATIRMSNLVQKRQLIPCLQWEWILPFHPIGREFLRTNKILHTFSEKVIKERKEAFKQEQMMKIAAESESSDAGTKKKISFLDLLIEISEKEKLTEEEIREEVDTFMFEGHDTTATAICWALFELGSHPDIQEKVYQELREIFQDSDRVPTNADLAEMKYLERVIRESLRLYPSVPLISRKLKEEIVLNDYKIPAGCNVPVMIYHIHRDPRLYPEPEKFDPDRFLPEAIQGRHPYSYIPFSAGPRNCIGQRFAMMEEKVILAQVLRNFHITSLDKREDIKLMAELILRPKNNLRILFKPRQELKEQ